MALIILEVVRPTQNKSNTSMVNSNADCIEGDSPLIVFPVYIPDVNRTFPICLYVFNTRPARGKSTPSLSETNPPNSNPEVL